MRRNSAISETPVGALIILGFMFLGSFMFFILLASNYVPFFLGEKIESTIVGVDSIYHKPRNMYRYDYFTVIEYSKKDIKEKIPVASYAAKKSEVESEIGQKREVYYKKGFGVFDPKEMFFSNTLLIVLFFFWFPLGMFFYFYFKCTYNKKY